MLNFLFGAKSPTRRWPPYAGEPLKFDLDRSTLNRVQLGQPLEAVRFLGPDEQPQAGRHGEFYYYSLGLEVCTYDSDTIREFHLVYQEPDALKFKPFAGEVRWGGAAIDLASLTPETFVEQFGEYYWRADESERDEPESDELDEEEDDDADDADDEVTLFYEHRGIEWQVEFLDGVHLSRLTITNHPLFDDPHMRKLFRLTKPWPPEHS
ncbi:MAG: hypothetical protein AAGF31_07825 [Planctomycetota bacterium]